jgi:DNA-directed RNA polymerase subunit RPC12/RpoP
MILFEYDDCPECGAEESIIEEYDSMICTDCGQEWSIETGIELN